VVALYLQLRKVCLFVCPKNKKLWNNYASKHNTTHKHKTQNTQQTAWAATALPSSGFAVYPHGNIRHGLKWRHWGYLWVRCRLPAVSSRSLLLVPLLEVPTHDPSKNRVMGGELALGGRCFMIWHHNQPDNWRPWYGGAKGEARAGGSAWGALSNRLDRRIEQPKIMTTKYMLALTA
jgi:hypothetical protein